MAELKTRKLNTQDFWAVLNILRKGGKDAFKRLRQADNSEDDNARAFVILDVGMQYAQEDLAELLASLADMSKEEYEQSDFDTTLTIIEQLEEQNDLAGFFQRVANLAKKFSAGKKTA